MSDDDYIEAIGGERSEDAIEPGQTDDAMVSSEPWEAPVVRSKPRIPRTDAGRKAMAEMVARFAAERAAAKDEEGPEGGFGDSGDDDALYAVAEAAKPKPVAPPPAKRDEASTTERAAAGSGVATSR